MRRARQRRPRTGSTGGRGLVRSLAAESDAEAAIGWTEQSGPCRVPAVFVRPLGPGPEGLRALALVFLAQAPGRLIYSGELDGRTLRVVMSQRVKDGSLWALSLGGRWAVAQHLQLPAPHVAVHMGRVSETVHEFEIRCDPGEVLAWEQGCLKKGLIVTIAGRDGSLVAELNTHLPLANVMVRWADSPEQGAVGLHRQRQRRGAYADTRCYNRAALRRHILPSVR